MYSVLPVEAELFPENSGVAKKEATCFEDYGWDCLNSNEPTAGNTFACILFFLNWNVQKQLCL